MGEWYGTELWALLSSAIYHAIFLEFASPRILFLARRARRTLVLLVRVRTLLFPKIKTYAAD
jgi:hypothetical protein